MKVSHFTEEELRAQDEAYLAALEKARPKPPAPASSQSTPSKPIPEKLVIQLTPEEAVLRDKWARVIEMVQKGRLDALHAFWEREAVGLGGIDARVPELAGLDERERGATLLMIAARAGQAELVQWLLDTERADPTVDVPALSTIDEDHKGEDAEGTRNKEDEQEEENEDGAHVRGPPGLSGRKTAYDLARTREVRNVFRRSAAMHSEWWDWLGMERGGARVPSVLSAEMEGERDEKRKVRRKGLKERVKEREARDKDKGKASREASPVPPPVSHVEKVREESSTGARKLGGSAGSTEGVAGLTPEMRLKVERERRARAIEARLKNLK